MVAKVISVVLAFAYIHDHNYSIAFETENITQSKSKMEVASMLNLAKIFEFCMKSADEVRVWISSNSRWLLSIEDLFSSYSHCVVLVMNSKQFES